MNTTLQDLIDQRYVSIIELVRSLGAVSDWDQLAACVSAALAPGLDHPVRLWATLPDGPQEIVRHPGNRMLPSRDSRVVRRAASAPAPQETEDGFVLIGLQAGGTPLGVLELASEGADPELVWHVAPLVALRAAGLAANGTGGLVLAVPSADPEVATVMNTFAAQAKQLLDHDRLSAYLLTPDGRSVERFAVATSPALPGEGVIVPFSEFGLRHILLTNRALVSEDLASDSRIVGREDRVVAQAGFHGLLSVPLRLDGKPFGVLNFVSRTAGFYHEQDALLGQQVADQVAVFFAHLRRQRAAQVWTRHTVAEHERARLARELHDTLARAVPEIARGARALASETADLVPGLAAQAQILAADAETALADTRRALVNLVPPALESHTIEEVIEAELTLLRGTQKLETAFAARGDATRLTLGARRAVYRILQEGVANVRQHAHATRVEVTLDVGRDLTLTIEDNGIGFDPACAYASDGLGLRFMRERAQSLGGSLRVESFPDRGTTLVFELPYVGQAAEVAADAWQAAEARPMTGVNLRVFVIESHPLLLAGLKQVFGQRNDVRLVGDAPTGREAHGYVARLRPDVVLLDVDADTEEAEAVTRQMKQTSPTTVVVGMSDMGMAGSTRLIEHGASGVVSKDLGGDELVEVIAALAGGSHVSSAVDAGGPHPASGTRLTPRERAILALVAAGQTNAEIGQSLFLATKTIERHVASIASKLGAQNRAHAAALAVATGLVRLDPPS